MNIWLAEIWRAWRASLRKPGFLLLASGVLALGVGASVTAFTLLDQMVLKPFPLPQASRLVVLGKLSPKRYTTATARGYAHLQSLDGVRSIGVMSLYDPSVNVVSKGVPQRTRVTYLDRNLLPTLGLNPLLGRNFNAREDTPYGPKAVMLTHDFWERHYNGDPDVMGQVMKVKGVPRTIIGVLPEQFDDVGTGGDIVLPAAFKSANRDDHERYLVVARLAEGATLAGVGAEVNARLHALYADSDNKSLRHAHFGARSFHDDMTEHVRHVLVPFQACGLLVLLIALVNLTSLMLLRAFSRHHDLAVREAMGAPRFRLGLPVMAEGLLVGVLGSVLGIMLAVCGIGLIRNIVPAEVIDEHYLHMDTAALALAVLVACLGAFSAMALGMWRARRIASVDELREGGRSGDGRYHGRLTRVLVIAQVTLAVILLGICGTFLHNAYRIAHVPLGFSSRHILTATVTPTRHDYPDTRSVASLAERMRERLRGIPGVTDATVTTGLPVNGIFGPFVVHAHAPDDKPFATRYHGIGEDYFKLFDVKLVQGRYFTRNDVHGSMPVAIVSQTVADRYYGGHALGKHVRMEHATAGNGPWQARIVGVVKDTVLRQASRRPPGLYVPLAQVPELVMAHFRDIRAMHLVLHVQGNPYRYRKALREAVAAVAPEQPVTHIRDMQAVIFSVMGGALVTGWTVGCFALLAMLLAGIGMYAVMAVTVATREHELGVRKALGASFARLAAFVLRRGLIQVLIGLVIGLVLMTLSLMALKASFSPQTMRLEFDPLVASGVCVFLLVFGLLACLVPAVRAGRVQPMHALRGE